jgi:DNA-binding transcriptional ArsR family regulator
MLRGAPEQPANMRLSGLRGVGKTVLLAEFKEQAEKAGWAVSSLELAASHNHEAALASALRIELEGAKRRLSTMQRIKGALGDASRAAKRVGVTYNDIKMTIDPLAAPPTAQDLADAFIGVVNSVVKAGRTGFLLLLDEAQSVRDDRDRTGQHPLSMLIAAISGLQREELPLGVVLCGLPTLTGNLLRARSYTERMFRGEEVGRLDENEAASAFTEPLKSTTVVATDELVDSVVGEVEGYPYFIQLWGAELWDAAVSAGAGKLDKHILKITRPEIYRRLDVDFYEPRLATLTPAEQDLLLASAKCNYPPLETIDLNDAIDKSPGNVNVLLGRLVEAGVLYRLRKGQYEYTAPKFREYLVRRTAR